MIDKNSSRWMAALSFALAAAGFLLPFWPLSLMGILLAALSGRWVLALFIGFLLDVAYGAPIGRLHFLYFPFTLAAFVGDGIYYFLLKYMRKSSKDTL